MEPVEEILHVLDGRGTLTDELNSVISLSEDENDEGKSQNMLDLLFKIAEDNARREGYIHRGVECNGCGVHPIQGIRYHCANCYDFDLCETCEAQQIHIKTHVFYKVRIPAPIRGHIKHVAPVWYPGKPGMLDPVLPLRISNSLVESTGLEKGEIDAFYDQFRCLAGHEWPTDPTVLGMAIDRRGFDKYFMAPSSLREPPPNLIYDRIFAYYDSNNDGFIGFEEFAKGLAGVQDKTRHARLQRIFKGYDMDDDGYVDRKDFLRMFRAYYALSKEITREMIAHQEEDMIDDSARNFIEGSAPISTAFTGSNLQTHASRAGEGKEVDAHGDLVIEDGQGALEEDLPPYGDRNESIGISALRNRSLGDTSLVPETSNNSHSQSNDDFENTALPQTSVDIPPTGEITDHSNGEPAATVRLPPLETDANRQRSEMRRAAIAERWKRRQFYVDVEEGMTAPPGYTEHDSSEDEGQPPRPVLKEPSPEMLGNSRRTSLRSRSSSKVRFEDDFDDTDHETRSNTSSRSIPVGERWGGFEINEAEKEIGKEILYQAVQQGFNSLLDLLFKEKEDLAMEAAETRPQRAKWSRKLEEYERKMKVESGVEEYESRPPRQTEEKDDHEQDTAMAGTEESLAQNTTTGEEGQNLSTEIGAASEVAMTPISLPGLSDSDGHGPPSPNQSTRLPLTDPESNATPHPNGPGEDISPASPAPGVPRPPSAAAPAANGCPPNSQISDADSETEPSSSQLALWARHNAVDLEAKHRGGHGKLSFAEFESKMTEDEEGDEAGPENEQGEDEGRKDWRKNSSLGRLTFVGQWLEMASF